MITELWLRFNEILQTCPSHGMPDKTLLDCFYRGLEPNNRRIAKNLFEGGMMSQPYQVFAILLNNIVETTERVKINTSGIN